MSRNVWMLGLTSLLTDASAEMITSVLPVYAFFFLRTTPLTFGLLDGLQRAGPSLVRLLGGWATDRWRWYKEFAVLGYLASTLSRLGMLASGRDPAKIAVALAVDRLGKGFRTSPRDALISLSAPREGLAAAFGVHRSLDTAGAMIGPLLAFAVLRGIDDGYDVVFVISFALGLLGLGVLVTFVRSPGAPALEAGTIPRSGVAQLLEPRFATVAVSATLLGVSTIGDSLIYLVLQERTGFQPSNLPLFFVATPTVYFALAARVGRWADHIGRSRVIVLAYLTLLILYGVLLAPLPGPLLVVTSVVLLGTFYAGTDGVWMALASAELPADRRATGLSIISTCNDTGRALSSVLFGWVWSRGSWSSAVMLFVLMLLVTLSWTAVRLRRAGGEAANV